MDSVFFYLFFFFRSKRSVTDTFFRFFRDRNAVLYNIIKKILKQRRNQETENKSEQNVVFFENAEFL
jgi:hypothetical protein